jgi:MSHA biogenesis protein MshJ
LNVHWGKLTAKVGALSRRERQFMLLAVIWLVYLLINSSLLAPLSKQKDSLKDQLLSDRVQRVSMQQQLELLASNPQIDPDAANRSRLAAIKTQLQRANVSLDEIQRKLVSAEKMTALLQDILKTNNKIKLVSLKTLPVVAASSAVKLSLYEHGVVLTIQGRYLDLLTYMNTLEELPWHMLWGDMNLATDASPESTLTVTIYTLSLDETWLTI